MMRERMDIVAELVEMWWSECSTEADMRCVAAFVKRLNNPTKRDRRLRPRLHRNASMKLTDAEAVEAIRLYAAGATGKQLAKMYKVGASTMYSMLRGTTYRHLHVQLESGQSSVS